jgi:hypothetical protein
MPRIARPDLPHNFRPGRGLLLPHLVWIFFFLCMLLNAPAAFANGDNQPTLLLVVGAPGEAVYGIDFDKSAALWQEASQQSEITLHLIGQDEPGDLPDLELFKERLASLPRQGHAPLWIVLIGHGTFDGRDARFNLRGPDFTAAELATWLEPFQRPIAIINGASASGPFLQHLSGPDRVIVTATRSGYEQNYARFGLHFAKAIADPAADLDKDGQVSILEAFLVAARRVAEFYETEGRLATEHALIDDNGDGRGTPADWFEGLRVTRQAADGALPDGFRARQWHLVPNEEELRIPPELRQRRDQIELEIAQLRELKSSMDDSIYYRQLESFLLELAHLYEALDLLPPSSDWQ